MLNIKTLLNSLLQNFNFLSVLCFVLLLISIKNLNEKSTSVYYRTRITNEAIKYISICVKIKTYNCSNLNEKTLGACRKLNRITNYIQNAEIKKTPKQILEQVYEEQIHLFFEFRPGFNLTEYYLLYNHICISYNNTDYRNSIMQLYNSKRLTATLFFHDRHLKSTFTQELFKHECDDFVECEGYTISEFKFKLNYLPSPYNTKCENYNKKKLPFTLKRIEKRSDCINELIKSQFNLSHLLYSKQDDNSFIFRKDESLTLPSELLNEQYAKYCEKPSCLTINHLHSILVSNHIKNRLVIETERPLTYKTLPLFPRFSYWLHTSTLVSSIFGVSLIDFSNLVFGLFLKRLPELNSKKIKILNTLKWTSLILFSLVNTWLIIDLLIDTKFKYHNENDKLTEGKYKLNLCFPLFKIFKQSSYLNQTYLSTEQNRLLDNITSNLTLKELNENTFELDQFLVNHEQLSFEREFYLFRSKCFEAIIDFKHEDYLYFNFTNYPFYSFLIWHNQTLISDELMIASSIEIVIAFHRQSFRCLDYTNFEFDNKIFNCSSKQNCIDRLYLFKFVRKHRRLPFYIIFQEDFDKFKDFKFINDFDQDLYLESTQTLNSDECFKIDYHRYTLNRLLHIENYKILKLIRPKFGKLEFVSKPNYLNDILIECFNLYSCIGLITYLISLFKIYKSNNLFLRNCQHIFMKIFCSFCFFIHIYLILKNSKELFLCQHFEYDILKENDLPFINICLNLTDELVRNHFNLNVSFQNGLELEEQTKHIQIEDLIENLRYIDSDYKLKVFKFSNLDNNLDSIKLSTFYLQTHKCFSLKPVINFKDFRLILVEKELLAIAFRPQLKNLTYKLSLFHQLDFLNSLNKTLDFKFNSYHQIRFDLISNQTFDFFDRLDFPTFEELRNEFKRLHLHSTLVIPLTNDYLKFKINDSLFNQFLANKTDQFDHISFIRFSIKSFEIQENDYHVKFSKSSLKRVLKNEKKRNFNTILVECFSSLSTWFNFCFLDLINFIFSKLKLFLNDKLIGLNRFFKFRNQVKPN